MPLSLKSEIRADDIADIDALKPCKVFLLRGKHNDDLIIKNEGPGMGQKRPISNSAMKAVDKNARMRQLSLPELEAIQAFAEAYQDYYQILFGKPWRPKTDQAAEQLKKEFSKYGLNPSEWFKMDKLQLRNLDSTLRIVSDNERDSALSNFGRALSRNGGLGKLGEIVAADAIIGNTDRFTPWGRVPSYKGNYLESSGQFQWNIALKCVQNAGNIFVAMDPETGTFRPSGVDYLDPSNSFDKFEPMDADQQARWPAQVLLKKETRLQYAKDVASDLERLLNPRNRIRLSPALGFHAAAQIEAGMISGAKKIYGKFADKYNSKPMPEGVKQRLVLLNDIV